MRAMLAAGITLCVAVLLCQAGPVTVVNGGFETGNFTGWTQSGNTGFTSVVCSGGAEEGSCYASIGPIGSLGYITQNLTTTPGTAYDITFWLSGSGNPNEFQVSWDGSVIYDTTNLSLTNWTQMTLFGNLASTGSTALQFGLRNDPDYLHLDNISVASTATPEPSSVLLLAAGVLAIGLLQRMLKRRVS